MEAFFLSTAIVALAEIGDKTQLLAFLLAAKFKKPIPIICGIFIATVANHFLAGLVGSWITDLLGPDSLRWILGLSFIAMAIWIMIPDKVDGEDTRLARYGAFVSTVVVFFLAEMGDKTQVATVALAAKYTSLFAVVAGTTLGMMLANVPAVYLSEMLLRRISLKWVHGVTAVLFVLLGIATLFKGDLLAF